MISVGIIGCGRIAQTRHIPEYAENPNARIKGLFDTNTNRARELAKEHGVEVYESVEAMLADAEIDAVSVCVSNALHAQISIAALKAGKHVLCEKPMATSLSDCENMVKSADEAGKFLMIGQNQRLAKAHVMAKELIARGEIGRVITFQTYFGHGGPETWSVDPGKGTWFFDRKTAVMGAMADLGIHKTDLIQYLLNDDIIETRAKLSTLDKRYADGKLIGVDDNAFCIYTMKGGAIGTMTASWTNYGEEDNSTIIRGDKGIIHLYDDDNDTLYVRYADNSRKSFEADKIQTNDNQTKSGIIDMFVAAIVTGKQPEISGKDVLRAMKAVFASIESSETGKAVRV